MNEKYTYIVLLNWNGWQDTIACLDSLFSMTGARFRVVVCDNQSSDNSFERIDAWSRGELLADQPDHPRLQATMGARSAPVAALKINAEQALSDSFEFQGEPLVIIDNLGNLGFAGGNNVGLRFALSQPDMSHVWILNNDTLVEPDCLANMLARLGDDDNAVCGSMIHFFDNPEIIQAIGGNRFNERTGVALQSEGRFLREDDTYSIESIEKELDYISGCSMLIPRALLERVGLLNDEYFLYYEEIDWFTRAGPEVKRLIAPDGRIYHREGGSIGSPSERQSKPSLTADFHIFRSKHLFMRKFHRANLWGCYLSTGKEAVKRIVRGQFSNARVVLRVLMGDALTH